MWSLHSAHTTRLLTYVGKLRAVKYNVTLQSQQEIIATSVNLLNTQRWVQEGGDRGDQETTLTG